MQQPHPNNSLLDSLSDFKYLLRYQKDLYSQQDILKTLLMKPLQLQMELITVPQIFPILYLNPESVDSSLPDMLKHDSILKSIDDQVKYLEATHTLLSNLYRDI